MVAFQEVESQVIKSIAIGGPNSVVTTPDELSATTFAAQRFHL